MTAWANLIAVQFLDGAVYFVGLGVASAAAVGLHRAKNPWLHRSCRLGVISGAILVLVSATPAPSWVYTFWLAVLMVAAFAARERAVRPMLSLLCVVSVLMAAFEIPHRLMPYIPVASDDTLFVVGDSLTQGARPPGKNWPELLGEALGLKTRNLGVPGARLKDALAQARQIDPGASLVLVEMGGNDLLAGTRCIDKDLDALLEKVCAPGRRVIMLELPLPPFFNSAGAAQRTLAAKHGVTLIPKWCLAGVLGAPGATDDGLHLSSSGHAWLAEELRPAFAVSESPRK